MKIVTVAGIRPDFIRLSEIIRKLDAHGGCEHILIHTGQHFDKDLSGQFFEELDIRQPDINLLAGGGNHVAQLCNMLPKMIYFLSTLVDKREPHLIVFLGDSNSVLLAPFLKKEGYKIAHIEALMRSGDMRMLEETNRICCDSVSDLLLTYCSSYLPYSKNLFGKSVVVGNTIVEPTLKHRPYGTRQKSHILVDIHRPENFLHPERMQWILKTCKHIGEFEELPVLFLEFPRTLAALKKYDIKIEGIETIPLVGFKKHLQLEYDSKYIVSDSGTDQEQPALLNIPVFVPREYTERPLSYSTGCSRRLTKEMTPSIISFALEFMYESMNASWLYPPNGVTSDWIVNSLLDFLIKEEGKANVSL